jgi:hypothetical protein
MDLTSTRPGTLTVVVRVPVEEVIRCGTDKGLLHNDYDYNHE